MAPFIFRRWRAEEETNQMKGSISALLRIRMVQSWARRLVLQSQVSITPKSRHFKRCIISLLGVAFEAALVAERETNKVFKVRARKKDGVWKRPIGVLMKGQPIWKVRSCPGGRVSNAKERMTPIHWLGLSCYCTLITLRIVLLESFLIRSWFRILKGEKRSFRHSWLFGTVHPLLQHHRHLAVPLFEECMLTFLPCQQYVHL